jgi:hypothetical protein
MIGGKVFAIVMAMICCLAMAGCATVPMATPEMDAKMKAFPPPEEGKAGLYIFRDSSMATAIVDDISLDGTVIGRLAINTFMYRNIEPGPHELSIPTEFARYKIDLTAEAGKHHYVRYYMRVGLIRANGALKTVEPSEAQKRILKCKLAQ